MPENFKPYNLEKAQEEAKRMKDIVGQKATGEDYTVAHDLVEEENLEKTKQEIKSKFYTELEEALQELGVKRRNGMGYYEQEGVGRQGEFDGYIGIQGVVRLFEKGLIKPSQLEGPKASSCFFPGTPFAWLHIAEDSVLPGAAIIIAEKYGQYPRCKSCEKQLEEESIFGEECLDHLAVNWHATYEEAKDYGWIQKPKKQLPPD